VTWHLMTLTSILSDSPLVPQKAWCAWCITLSSLFIKC